MHDSLFIGSDVHKVGGKAAWEGMEPLLAAVVYKVHAILKDTGIQFAVYPRTRNTGYSGPMRFH